MPSMYNFTHYSQRTMKHRLCVMPCAVILFIMVVGVCPVPAQQFDWPYREHLQKEIHFWKNIFTRYTDDQYVLHDQDDLGIVYNILTFSSHTPSQERERKIALEKYEITKQLLEIAKKIECSEALEKHQQDMVKLFGARPSPHTLRLKAHQVRAQQGICNRFQKGLERSHAFMPTIKKIFKDSGLPEELAYLPHVESSFNIRARSRSGAVGIWQFMPKTAQMFMKINSIVDERYDITASTKAAASLLALNYKETGDWGLAITAYNHGLNGIKRAAEQQGRNYLDVRRHYSSPIFQFASKNFYPEFLAAVEIVRNQSHYFPSLKPERMPSVIRYTLKKSVSLPLFARQCHLDTAQLQELNPAYTQKAWQGRVPVPAGYALNLPATVNIAALNAYIEQETRSAALKKMISENKTNSVAKGKDEQKQPPKQQKPSAVAAASPEASSTDNQTQSATTSRQRTVSKPSSGGPVATADLSLEALRQELREVLAVHNQTIEVFGSETIGHYAKWLNVPPQNLLKLNMLKATNTLRQKQKLQLDFSRVTPEEFQTRRLNHHLASLELFVRQHNLDALLNYKLGQGETLCMVAQQQYKVPLNLMLYFNSQRNLNNLGPGAVVRIPVSKARLVTQQDS